MYTEIVYLCAVMFAFAALAGFTRNKIVVVIQFNSVQNIEFIFCRSHKYTTSQHRHANRAPGFETWFPCAEV